MEAGSVSTWASIPSAISWPAISVRFSAEPLPAKASIWATMGAIGAGGWRAQTASHNDRAVCRDPFRLAMEVAAGQVAQADHDTGLPAERFQTSFRSAEPRDDRAVG